MMGGEVRDVRFYPLINLLELLACRLRLVKTRRPSPRRMPVSIPSIGNPGMGGIEKSVAYDATYVSGAVTVIGLVTAAPVGVCQLENLWMVNPSGIVSFTFGVNVAPFWYQVS